MAAILAVAGCWFVWPATLGGQTTYVTTSGRSMEPRFHSGDLAVVRAAGTYRVGDVVAYHSDLLRTVVMHRVVAVDDGHHTFKGDNNSWLDPERPTLDRLIGRLALRVPQGGVWFDRLASPPVLGFLALLLLATGGAAAETKRQRRRRAMSRQTTSSAHRSTAGRVLSPRMEIAAAVIATVAVLGAGLGVLAWGAPLDSVRMVERHVDQSMTFSYSTSVPKSAAYDGMLVTSPDPVFRKLANAAPGQDLDCRARKDFAKPLAVSGLGVVARDDEVPDLLVPQCSEACCHRLGDFCGRCLEHFLPIAEDQILPGPGCGAHQL